MKGLWRRFTDESGAAIALVALSMIAMLSAVALAVDVGMLTTARTEAQTVVDGAALAGARILRDSNGDSLQAHNAAVAAGSADNTVRGSHVTILDEDVDVIPAEWTVRVRASRTKARGNAVPTFFARIFGVGEVNISAHAAAWAATATTVGPDEDESCPVLPLALLDEWVETNGQPGWQPGETITGFDAADNGKVIRLKQTPNAGSEPPPVVNDIDYCETTANSASWRCWWRLEEENSGNPNIENRILGTDCGDPLQVGDHLWSKPGGAQSNVHQEFEDVIASDPDLAWCDNCAGGNPARGCVVDASRQCFTGTSLRLRSVPIVDPQSVNGTGNNTNGQVTGFVGVFVEKVAQTFAGAAGPPGKRNVYLRLVVDGGTGTGGGGGEESAEGLVRVLQLIE